MAFEREKLVEAGLATLGVVVFIAIVMVMGSMSGEDLGEQGTFAMLGAILVFLLVMAGIGLYLSTRD